MAERGKFVVVEGGVGCGKTTQTMALDPLLRKTGEKWVITNEPGGTEYGELMRQAVQYGDGYIVDPYAALFGYSSSRANLVKTLIIPSLENGENVFCDRYWYSTFAYQGAERVSKVIIWAMSRIATGGLKPNVVLHFDLPPELGIARKKGVDLETIDRYDKMKVPFHRRVRKNYKTLKLLHPKIWEIIDASVSKDEVTMESVKRLRKHNINV